MRLPCGLLAACILGTPLVSAASGPRPAAAPVVAPSSAADTGIVAVPRPTGSDPAALARRVELLEQRLDAVVSLQSGPDVLQADAVERLATRLVALEARTASIEEATGIRQARASAGDPAVPVALTLALLAGADGPELLRVAREGDPSALDRLRYMGFVVRLAAWPRELAPQAARLAASLDVLLRAASGRGADPQSAARSFARARHELAASAAAWMSQAASHAASHSGIGPHMDHAPRHGGLVGMSGDVHLELVARDGDGPPPRGRWDVYLSDAYRTPLPVSDAKGTLIVMPDAPGELRMPLGPDAEGALEAVGGPAPSAGPVDVRVVIDAPSGHVEMDFRVMSAAAP